MSGVPRLEVTGAAMTFGASRALDGVSLQVAPGEVHGLLGQNGSGKSTLVKILSGYHRPDAGTRIRFDGQELRLPLQPATLQRHGIAVVHQDLGLVDDASVVENICVGARHRHRFTRRIDRAAERSLAATALDQLGQRLALDTRVGRLGTADRVSVAIARALLGRVPGPGLVVFDESTRALPPEELAHFHALVRRLRAAGEAVLMVTHHLAEALGLGDRITVLRDGRAVVAGAATAGLTERELTTMLLGRDLRASALAVRATVPDVAEGTSGPGVQVRARWRRGSAVRSVELDLAAGSIVGVTGRAGSGAEELPAVLTAAGADRIDRVEGEVRIGTQRLDLATGRIRDALEAGIALVPEGRAHQGVALDLSLRDNVALPQLRSRARTGWLPSRWQHEEAARVIDELGVRPPDPDAPLRTLSGGNQQKVVLGKWLRTRPRLLVLHEPTQGVDVGAREDIHDALRTLAATGATVLYVAADAHELAMACTRVVVLSGGRVGADLAGPVVPVEAVLDATYPADPADPTYPADPAEPAEAAEAAEAPLVEGDPA